MENFENIQSVNQTLTDDSKIKTYLLEISKWGKFLYCRIYRNCSFGYCRHCFNSYIFHYQY